MKPASWLRRANTRTIIACLGLCACVILTSGLEQARADEPFYKGKRITLMVNFAAGGASDIEGRLFAKHLARHVDGRPSIVVQNREGAGGLIGTNYLGEVAPRDGTVIGHLTGTSWRYINDPERFRVDFKSFEFIGYQGTATVYFVRTDVAPGIRLATDIVKAEGLVSGGLGPDNTKDLLIRLGLELLGIPHLHVTSYRSSSAARLALQRGEINFYSESPQSYRSVIDPGLVKEGLAIPVWHDLTQDGAKLAASKQVEGLGIMPYHEIYRAIKGTMPSGPMWEARLAINTINGTMLRTVALPPGAPAAALDALRTAVARLNHDKAYAEDAVRSIGFVPEYETGPDTNRQVRDGLTVRPEIRAFIADYVKKAGK